LGLGQGGTQSGDIVGERGGVHSGQFTPKAAVN
jgi:hypothetical protein